MRSCDGAASVSDVVDELARKYDAGRDVTAMLQDLADKGFLVIAAEAGNSRAPA